MSSILLSNPFIQTPPPPAQVGGGMVSAIAVAAVQGMSGSGGTGSAASDTGSGLGHGTGRRQHDTAALMQSRPRGELPRPSEATPHSVIDAQTRNVPDYVPFGANLPKVAMPDPIPTSPFLKRI